MTAGTQPQYTYEAHDKREGMTIDELEQLCVRLRTAGMTGHETIWVETKVRWTLKRAGSPIIKAHVLTPEWTPR